MKRISVVSGIVVCLILSVAAFLQASGIVPALVPAGAPSANRRGSLTPGGGSGIFQLATSAAAGSAGSTVCDDGTGSYGTGVSGCVSASPLFSQTNSVTDSTTGATTLTGTGTGSVTLPANFFAAGTVLHFAISGYYSTTATPGVLTMLVKLGAVTVGSSGAISPLVSVTNGAWRLWGDITCRTAGAGGTVIVNTIFETGPSSLAVLTPAEASMANITTVTIDTTVTEAFDVTANFGSASQSITSTNYVLTSFGGGGGGGGGTTVTVAAPYITVGGTKYVGATMWPFTAFPSGSFLDGNTCTNTAGANGSELMSCALNVANAWYSVAATTSIEAEFAGGGITTLTATNVVVSGIWMCDTTNGKIYTIDVVTAGVSGNLNVIDMQTTSFTLAACSGTPSAGAVRTAAFPVPLNSTIHAKLLKSGGNLLFQISMDGGQTFSQVDSVAVGTLAKAGYQVRDTGNFTALLTAYSTVIN
jgi:hypothetical protein